MLAAAVALLMALAIAGPSWAQVAAEADATPAAQAASLPADTAVDPGKMGVSMSRIQRGLRLSEAREQSSGSPLKLEYQVQVFGSLPRIEVLKDFDISTTSPLSYGAPTHADFLRQWTPQAYRSPRWPVGALAGWAFLQVAQRSEKAKCEEAIAAYRALVMQGVPTPAPRCTQ